MLHDKNIITDFAFVKQKITIPGKYFSSLAIPLYARWLFTEISHRIGELPHKRQLGRVYVDAQVLEKLQEEDEFWRRQFPSK